MINVILCGLHIKHGFRNSKAIQENIQLSFSLRETIKNKVQFVMISKIDNKFINFFIASSIT